MDEVGEEKMKQEERNEKREKTPTVR